MSASAKPSDLWDNITPRRTMVLTVIAFPYALGAIYGAGAEVVFYGFLLLLAGVLVFVWVRWRALVPADAITIGSGGAR